MACFPTPPLFAAFARGNPSDFLDETYHAKTRWIGLPYGENFVISSSTVSTDPSVWQTDGRTDGRAITLRYMLSRAKSLIRLD